MPVAVVALQTFLHGSLKARSGGVYHLPDKLAEDLMRAGLIKYATIAQASPEKKTKRKLAGKDAMLSVSPAAPALPPTTARVSDVGERMRRNRGASS